jgi:hypothetical protein
MDRIVFRIGGYLYVIISMCTYLLSCDSEELVKYSLKQTRATVLWMLYVLLYDGALMAATAATYNEFDE